MRHTYFSNWLPAVLTMAVIFWFSSRPAEELPVFSWADAIIKKLGHIAGYAILTFSYWRGLGMKQDKRWLAWLLALLFAVTDEIHQSFVPGRHAGVWDVLIFDNLGALTGLWTANKIGHRKRADVIN